LKVTELVLTDVYKTSEKELESIRLKANSSVLSSFSDAEKSDYPTKEDWFKHLYSENEVKVV
jgi:TPP-dependent pyruvate/acetoin dehydrogenase alpha subunit